MCSGPLSVRSPLLLFLPPIHVVAEERGEVCRVVSWPGQPEVFHDCVLIINISTQTSHLTEETVQLSTNNTGGVGYMVIKEDENRLATILIVHRIVNVFG